MNYYQKVMWSEGLFLTPHHLQQWDRYHESLLHRRLRAVEHLSWGVCDLKLNEEALTNGELIVSRSTLVLPDGLLVNIPDLDEAPPSRPVGPSFDPRKRTLSVYLAAPLVKAGAAACAADGAAGGPPTRYRRKFMSINDENTGSNQREVACALKDLRVLFEGEPLDDYGSIKIAEIEKTATGTFATRAAYVPPSLYLSASVYLTDLLKRLIEILSTKSGDLAKQRRQRAQGLVEFTMSEAANFWFLHTLNGFIPALLHYHNQPQTHPERLYLELSRLIGELYTFAGEGHPKDVPLYLHDDLSTTFTSIEKTVRLLLETVIPTRCVPIALERTRESLYTGRLEDDRLIESAQLYLAVMADVPDEKIAREVPLKAKISSTDRVERLITQALRGVGLRHLPTPPAEIPVQPGRSYFQLDKRGEHWDAVRVSRTMSIYLPPEFTGQKLELMAVKE